MSRKSRLYESIGKTIKETRDQKAITQDELAKRVGVTAATISLYESGDRKPELEKLKAIAKALETSEVFLMGAELDPTNIDLALRSEKLTPPEITQVKKYIDLIKKAKEKNEKKDE